MNLHQQPALADHGCQSKSAKINNQGRTGKNNGNSDGKSNSRMTARHPAVQRTPLGKMCLKQNHGDRHDQDRNYRNIAGNIGNNALFSRHCGKDAGGKDDIADDRRSADSEEDGTGGDILGLLGEGMITRTDEIDNDFHCGINDLGKENKGDRQSQEQKIDGRNLKEERGKEDSSSTEKVPAHVLLGAGGPKDPFYGAIDALNPA